MHSALSFILLLLVAFDCTSEARAIEFASSEYSIVPGSEMPDDPKHSYELAFKMLRNVGWTTQQKVPGEADQPQNSEHAAAVDARGPRIVWLPTNWNKLSDITRARMAWHEYSHVREQMQLGRDEMAYLLSKPHWRVALEIPASAQSLVVLGRYGTDQNKLHELADKAIDNYPDRIDLSELENAEAWYELGRSILHTEVAQIPNSETP